MALSEVGLTYVSNNASQFIHNAELSSEAVERLNDNLISISRYGSKQLNSSFNDNAKSSNLLTGAIKENSNVITSSIKIFDKYGTVLGKSHDRNVKMKESLSALPPHRS